MDTDLTEANEGNEEPRTDVLIMSSILTRQINVLKNVQILTCPVISENR